MDQSEKNLESQVKIATDGKLLEDLVIFEVQEKYEKCAIIKAEIEARKVRVNQAILMT